MDTRKEEQASLGVRGLPGCVLLRESHSCSEPPSSADEMEGEVGWSVQDTEPSIWRGANMGSLSLGIDLG